MLKEMLKQNETIKRVTSVHIDIYNNEDVAPQW